MTRLPVLDDHQRLLGVVSITDLLRPALDTPVSSSQHVATTQWRRSGKEAQTCSDVIAQNNPVL